MCTDPFTTPGEREVAALLRAAGMSPRFHLEPLPGGANNRVFRVRGESHTALLKAYYRSDDDPRDRLGAEWSFSRFAWDCGLRCVPQPLACDRERGLGLYEFLEGRRPAAGDVGMAQVREALQFFGELNRHKSRSSAVELPRAAESCFTLNEHAACVEQRLSRLAQLEATTDLDREAAEWVGGQLAPAWGNVRERLPAEASRQGLAVDAPLDPQDRCISPSDFGFHNAILGADGRLRFFDFEYAGWDDPAKMVCDFLCQPAIPVPEAHREMFARAAVADLRDPESHRRRISLLLPVYCVKWCCIMMNEFLECGGRRRRFARSEQDQSERKREQLRKAQTALAKLDAPDA